MTVAERHRSCTHSTPSHDPHIALTSTRCQQTPICRSCDLRWLEEASSSRSEAALKARLTSTCAHSALAMVVACSTRSSKRGSCSSLDLLCSQQQSSLWSSAGGDVGRCAQCLSLYAKSRTRLPARYETV